MQFVIRVRIRHNTKGRQWPTEEIVMNLPLTAEQRQRLELILRQEHEELSARRSAYLGGLTRAEHAREVLLQDGDDAPQRASDREIDLQRVEEDVARLADIDAALQRIAEGTYGVCRECGEVIPAERLEVAPYTRYCVACEAQRERGRKAAASL
ncbi:TraR/DksA C4-type zinc finger protein [Methyloversatilis sp. XJ19-49]|uniref:TraR/DksA family transcriptional regulator n=1 Tax=Methyloversatilis sp. XJ19-49 TaxID=2963429 RepID=UPI00211B78A4|nr:TraR/DksA C4-type zinc finger protein [Methyloversatilis sp. XJ19-49]MCQ9380163.1 TraR/DksA C4-type zinc finger protein [Methyloversatilis sp. XJ19-49]